MRLLGEHRLRLDDKGRLVLPASLREPLSQTQLILALGDYRELGLWPVEDFDRRASQKAAKEYDSQEDARAYRRFTSNAFEVRVDGQGRIAIPESLRSKAGFGPDEKDAVVMGVGNRVEIWQRARLEAFDQEGADA